MNQLPRHPALRALVQFEEQKHGVAVRWTEYVPDYLLDTRHRAEIHVITVPQTACDEREIGVADQRVRLRGIGAEQLIVWDPDSVAEHNIPNQWYGPGDVGRHKVTVLADAVHRMTGTAPTGVAERFTGPLASEITVCCVDSMDARIASVHALPQPRGWVARSTALRPYCPS